MLCDQLNINQWTGDLPANFIFPGARSGDQRSVSKVGIRHVVEDGFQAARCDHHVALKTARELFRHDLPLGLIQQAPDPVFLADPSGRVLVDRSKVVERRGFSILLSHKHVA